MSENAVQIGRVGANEKLGKKLHIAAKCGNRKKLKKILAKGKFTLMLRQNLVIRELVYIVYM